MQFRQARKNDSDDVARLHANSWQHTYRGMLDHQYLDNCVLAEKQLEWQQRLSKDFDQEIWVLLAEADQQLRGFSCLFFDYGSQGKTYMDNLHVDPSFQSKGLGKALLQKSLEYAWLKRPDAEFYLWVFENNARAIDFYLNQGADITGNELQDAPGGGKIVALELTWTNSN